MPAPKLGTYAKDEIETWILKNYSANDIDQLQSKLRDRRDALDREQQAASQSQGIGSAFRLLAEANATMMKQQIVMMEELKAIKKAQGSGETSCAVAQPGGASQGPATSQSTEAVIQEMQAQLKENAELLQDLKKALTKRNTL